jgi:hypothetical protein
LHFAKSTGFPGAGTVPGGTFSDARPPRRAACAGACAMGNEPRLLATGIREPGSVEFRLTIYGHAGRELPPAMLLASLLEFRGWIEQSRSAGGAPAAAGPLRVV